MGLMCIRVQQKNNFRNVATRILEDLPGCPSSNWYIVNHGDPGVASTVTPLTCCGTDCSEI